MGFMKDFEDVMAAVSFAEAGEFDTAREMLGEGSPVTDKILDVRRGAVLSLDDLTSMAITFAEAGEHEKALEILTEAEQLLQRLKSNSMKKLSPARRKLMGT
ncbi:MAG: tetratricopeptide repeat protein [Nitrospirota bacterium]